MTGEYRHYRFFNKKGEYLNFDYDEVNDLWTGRIQHGIVSEGLIEDSQIYILEEAYDTSSGNIDLTWPLGTTGQTSILAFFSPTGPTEHFLYGFRIGPTSNDSEQWLAKERSMQYPLEISSFSEYGGTGSTAAMKYLSGLRSEAMQINVGFQPTEEANYSNWLTIQDSEGHAIARIEVYGEGENEDERLRDILQNFGHDITREDTLVFDKSDIKESEPDWLLLNRKRKELIAEYEKIFPYIGSYKALINIIRFFGYQDVHLKEYWRNIDPTSTGYGKYRHTDIVQIFDKSANYRDSLSVPSKVYKKTNLFGLFYDITKESGEYDDQGIPIVEEVFSFTPEEILIKIFALKNKLKKYFLPTNARIIDIVGEAVYFVRMDTTARLSLCRIDSVSLSLNPRYNVLPSACGYMQDLRRLYHYGCPVGPDLRLDGTTDLYSWRIGIGNTAFVGGILDGIQTYRLSVNIPFGPTASVVEAVFQRDPDTGQTAYSNYEIANGIISAWADAAGTDERLSGFTLYQEGGTSGVIRILQTQAGGTGEIFASWFSNTTGVIPSGKYVIPGSTGGTSYTIDISPGGTFGASGAPMSYYSDCFLAYFDEINQEVEQLNDDEGIPVGYAVTLINSTFDITLDEAEVTFNELDIQDPNQFGPTGQTLYSQFMNSFVLTGWTSIYPNPGLPTGATYLSIPATAGTTGFPSNFPSQNFYSFENLGRYNFYEMQWKVTFDGEIEWSHDSGRRPISEIERYPLILPYVGTYTVELRMWDLYNTVALRIDHAAICVNIQESDFIGWYQRMEPSYTLDTPRYEVQSDYSRNDPRSKKPKELTLDEYNSTWDLPFHPNEEIGMADISFHSLDSIEFYQSITDEDRHPSADRNPYYFHRIGKQAKLDDLYHIWWDGIGTKITQFNISEIDAGATAYMYMSLENCPIDITSPSLNIYYEQGPTGFTGPIGITGTIGASGDIIYSAYDSSVYQSDGLYWRRKYARIEGIALAPTASNRRERFQSIVNQLNTSLYSDPRDLELLRSFIYYFDEKYDSDYSLKPYVRAVSKDFDKHGRHKMKFVGMTGESRSYETNYFGYLGDIPSHFEIYSVPSSGPSGSIMIEGMTSAYTIGATNLTALADELNGPTAQSIDGIKDFTYNIVLGWSGGTGSTSYYETKVQAISKAFQSPNSFSVEFENVIGTVYGRSLIKNPTFDSLRILKYAKELPLLTLVNFTYDNCKVHGKTKPVWKLTKEWNGSTVDTYDRNRYFSFLFTEKGSYTLSLQLEDTNGNVVETTKPELIKIV